MRWYAFAAGIHHKIGIQFLDNLYVDSIRLRQRWVNRTRRVRSTIRRDVIAMKLKKRRARSADSTPEKAGTQHSFGAGDNAPSAQWIRTALLILCLVLFTWHPVAAAPQRDVVDKDAVGAAGINFAIADFDGDSLPDFASVQPGLAVAAQTSYRIHFSFSLGQQSSFTVTAPTGGLQIASRDVNGDTFLDLIISTRIANEPVAVLLNDGRGNFHLAQREAFAWAIWEARSEWRARTACWDDIAPAMASTGWAARICASAGGVELLPTTARVSLSSQRPDYFVLLQDDRGRAPPAV